MVSQSGRESLRTADEELLRRRTRIARALLGSIAALGLLAYVPSLWLSVRVGAWLIAGVDTLAYAALLLVYFLPRVSYRVQAGTLVAVTFALGLILTLIFGPVSAGPLWLCAAPVLAAVLFERRALFAVLGGMAAALVAAALRIRLHPGVWGEAGSDLGLLAVIAGNLLLLATGMAAAVSALMSGLRSAAVRSEELASGLREERRRLEEANASLEREMAERAEVNARLRQAEKLAALGTLSGGIAHDLNNLLTPVLMGVEMLRAERRHDAELLGQMHDAAVGAREIVRQVLTFGRARAELPAPLPAEAVFTEAVRLLRASLPSRVALETRFEPELGAVALAPADAHQLVLNLGTNALHAIPADGRIVIRLERAHAAREGLDPGREYLQLAVRDTGQGMDPATLARAVEPFFTTKPPGQGTGLGLATVHGIVTAAGGTLRLESRPGEGTTVRVLLPRVARATAAPADEPDRGHPPPAPTGDGALVLVVDDEPSVRAVAAAFLRRLGYRVQEAEGVDAGLAWLRANPGRAEALLTDLNMPDGGGLALVRRARELQPGLEAILMSGFLDEEQRSAALQTGIRRILQKPFRMDELRATVAAVIAARRAARST